MNDFVPNIKVPESFKAFLNTIETEIATIPEKGSLSWGCWMCEELWQQSQLQIHQFFKENEIKLFKNILSYLWQIVDGKATKTLHSLLDYYQTLQTVDTLHLDLPDPDERVVYELVASLKSMLQYAIDPENNCALQLSKAVISVIDTRLQIEDKDIYTPEGFADAALQNELKAQLYMVWMLQKYKHIKSFDKHLFRNGNFPKLNREKVIAIVEAYRQNYPSLQKDALTHLQFTPSWDIEGLVWILTSEYELFGELREYWYVVSDKTAQVAYLFNEYGDKNLHIIPPKPKKKKRIHGVRTIDY
ncbi:hypothetical protein [Capnocytophaga sp. oral taxon 878]|uniref:hypothetical protein n=1 Tax=Capnocytophaga sp. oral taxon 878 TaxID=1316596 RepID=UPI000D0249F6|nr:hypothetical protein [Capnocytophaga sp. oral taxon 878]AVM50550.1 hypothetical protein C4H12_08710 [Capnocytophaga sp. oral taxon 878]